MGRIAVLIAAALAMVSCSQDEEVTGSVRDKCAAELFHPYDAKVMSQCVAVCIKCDHGSRVTCSTSCTLKGAR
jgi:hypothetical protein